MTNLPAACRVALARTPFQPIILKGQPGIAKTQFFKNEFVDMYAEHLGLQRDDIGYIQERIASRDACELAGVALPMKDENGNLYTQFTKPPLITKIEATGKRYGVCNLDEVLQGGADIQKVLADVLDPEERTMSGWPIPDGWIFVGTGNRAADKSGATRLLAHLNNRVRVWELGFEINSWANWARENGINPIVIDCAMAYHDQEFFADRVPTEDVAFCTPRSLVQASYDFDAYLDEAGEISIVAPWMEQVLASNIGPTAASTLTGWIMQAGEVPTDAELMTSPADCNVPEQTGFQMLAGSKAIALAKDGESGEKALQYIVRLRPDLQVSLGTRLLRTSARHGWVLTSGLAQQFIAKFHDLLPLAQDSGWR
jgi:hypothetical protein